MGHKIENITGESLTDLVSETMARKGCSVRVTPIGYGEIDILAVKRENNNIKRYFIVTAGRSSIDNLTERDMENAIPNTIKLSNHSQLLIVTNCRDTSREARRIAENDQLPKKMWYVSNLLNQLQNLNSEYLVELYDNNKYQYHRFNLLKERFEYQSINISDNAIQYIVNETNHPRKIIAYLELDADTLGSDIMSMTAIKSFKKQFPDISEKL